MADMTMFFGVLCCLSYGNALEVLNVGLPRTGTQSMHAAFQRLGFRSLHSGEQILSRVPACKYEFRNGSWTDVMPLLREYDAVSDEPFPLLYEEVMKAFPDAKFVLPVTDPEHWYDSYLRMKTPQEVFLPGMALLQHDAARIDRRAKANPDLLEVAAECSEVRYLGCDRSQNQTPALKQQCINGFNGHVASVKERIPASKLLLFNISEGWAPLCEFLGKPVPSEPFPHVDRFAASEADILNAWLVKWQVTGLSPK